ncbi:MAG TPA: hypothetical protein VFV76_13160 [Actinomycetes bacterium]|nr:hypothetical protein [Actinomycetes bacterium]
MRERTAAWLELHDALRQGAVAQDVLARADEELAEWFRELDGTATDQVQEPLHEPDAPGSPAVPQGRVDPLAPATRPRRPRPDRSAPPPPVEFDDPVRSVLARTVRAVAVLVVLRLRPALSRKARPSPPPRRAARRRPRLARLSGGVGRRLVTTAVVLVLSLAALAGSRLVLESHRTESLDLAPTTRAEVVGWLAGNVAGDARLVVHPDLRASVEAVLPGREIVSLGQHSGSAYDLVVAPAGGGGGDDLLLATFGSLEVRQPPGSTGWAQAREERRSTGQDLVAHPRLQVTSAAWTDLVEGDVDARLMDLIGAVLERTSLEVVAFQRGPAESAEAPIRAMEVAAVGDIRVGDGAEAAMSVRSLLMDVPLDLRADGLALATDSNVPALLVRMSLPSR